MLDVLAANALRVGLFRFTIAPVHPLLVPAVNKGNMLRGGFGHAFRRLCCIPQCQDPKTCPVAASCPYKAIFEPSPPPGADRLSKNQDIPRPFVFRPPLDSKARYNPGERLEFGLALLGKALDFLPYFVLSFREVLREGFGLNRAVCELEEVCSTPWNGGPPQAVYKASDELFRNPEAGSLQEWAQRHLLPPSTKQITVRFLTPTSLKWEGAPVRRPEFHHLFKRVRDRLNALSVFYGPGPIDADFKGLGEAAEKVRTIKSDIHWVDRYRTSSKTHQRHELSGFTGSCTYEFPSLKSGISNVELLEWLACGELIHAGRHTAWGNGWYQVGEERGT